MNERIFELAKQAKDIVRKEYGYVRNSLLPQEWVDEKFAELIVRECADIILFTASTPNDACEISFIVKKHFGVEE